MKRFLPVVFVLIASAAWSQNVSILKDINSSLNVSGSSPANFTNVGGTIFFTASDAERGTELWKTSGTFASTVLVKDINQGSGSSYPSYLTAIGSVVYFAASDGINGTEFWKSDAISGITEIVRDINPGALSSSPSGIIAAGSTLYFSANNGTNGSEVWKSDGTFGNTVQLTDIAPSSASSSPGNFTYADGIVYFSANNATYGTELWKTTGGTPSLVKDIYAGASSSSPYKLVAFVVGSTCDIAFRATTPANGSELWKSDGSSGGTVVVDIYSVLGDYTGSSNPDYLVSTGTYVYMAATSFGAGREIYRFDGSTATLVEDEVAAGNLDPLYLTNVSGTIFFSGTSGGDRELYKATSGTVSLVTNIYPGVGLSSSPSDFEPAGTTVFFSATDANGTELWKATTSTGATLVSNINPTVGASSYPSNKAYLGGLLYLSATHDTYGQELFLYNGSSTSLLKDINGGSEDGTPNAIFNTGTTLYFSANNGTTNYELWKSDGTTGGTLAVADINSTGVPNPSSSPLPFGFTNSLIHFTAYTSAKGYEFYVSNGTVGNFTLREINLVNENSTYAAWDDYVTMGNDVFFTANHPSYGYELWRSNLGGTATIVSDINSGTSGSSPNYLTVYGGYVYFAATDETIGRELYRTTGSGVTSMGNLNISGDFNPTGLCAVSGAVNKLFFAADNGSDGVELWSTNGGTPVKVKAAGIAAGSTGAYPSQLANVNGTLFFAANDGVNGTELWKSDGTDGGTVIVKDINPAVSAGSSPNYLTAVGTMLYFTATEATNGTELYKSDGTLSGTVLVRDIFLGTASSSPYRLKNINGTLYFRASNGAGLNLMKTNGTSQGTIVATSTGVSYQDVTDEIQYLNVNGGNVYWVGNTNTYGKELLNVKAEPLNQPASLTVGAPTATSLTLSWPAASGSTGYIVIRSSTGTPTGLPVDGVAPVINSPLSSGTGQVAYVGTLTGFTDLGLASNTTYSYKIYSYADGGSAVNIYKPHSPPSGSATTMAAEPTTQTTVATFNSITTNSMTVGWTEGNGAERLVIARASGAVSSGPIDGSTYTANPIYSNGSPLGSGFVVYKGSGNSVVVTGLTEATTYHFYMVELNGSGAQTNYLTTSPLTGNALTLALNGNQPTDLLFTSVGTTSMTLGWQAAGAGPVGYIVIRRDGVDPASDPPINMTPYAAGDPIGLSTVAYFGTGVSFNESSLTAGDTYYYRIYSFNGTVGSPSYVFGEPLGGSQTMLETEPTGAPGPINLGPYTTSLVGDFTAGTGADSYIVLERESSPVSPDEPVDGATYAVGNTIVNSKVVFVGQLGDLPFTSSGLTPNTIYHYAAFSAAGSGAATNYLTSSSSVASRTTLVDEPLAQPSDIVFDNLAPSQFDVSFTPASTVPDGYIVLQNVGSPVTDAPDDGVTYGIGNSVGASAMVVYVGTETAFLQTGLASNTTYHYAVMSYMGSGDATNYLVAGPAIASQVTPAAEPSLQPTGFLPVARTTTSLSFSFTAAATAPQPDGYLVLRNSGAAPTGAPIDGDQYTPGEAIGADVVVQVGNSVSVVDNNFGLDLVEDTQYFYKIFSFNGSAGTYNYLPTTPLEGNLFTLADEPVDHPINMGFTAPTTSSMTVAWDEPVSLPAGYLVMRSTAAPTGTPVDGVAYTLGMSTGNGTGTVVYIGTNPSFSSTGLATATIYHYAVYPYKGSGVSSNFLVAPSATPLPVLIGSRTTLQTEPAAQPTNPVFSNKSTTTVDVNFTFSGTAQQYLVLRRAGSPPTEEPVDGVEYPDNFVLGASVITYTDNVDFPFTDGAGVTAPMVAGTTYYYAIFGYNGTNGANNYLTPSPLTGSVALLALEPTAQPTVLTFSNVTGNSLTGSFTGASGAPSGYLVVRKAGGPLVGFPIDGTPYAVGEAVGDGEAVQSGSATTFNDSGLDPTVTYYYSVFSYNGNGGSRNYLTSSPLEDNQQTLAAEPSQPTLIDFPSITSTTLSLTFTKSDAVRYLVLRKASSAPPDVPVDGVGYTAGTTLGGGSDVAFSGILGDPPVIAESLLTPGTQYFYKIYGYNGASSATYNYNAVAPLAGSATTTATTPTQQPTILAYSNVTATSMDVSFTPPGSVPGGYLVVRKAGSASTDVPVDRTPYTVGNNLTNDKIVHIGAAPNFTDNGLTAGTTYFYVVFSLNGSGVSTAYNTTAPLTGSHATLAAEPAAQPTSLGFTSITSSSLSLGFTPSSATDYLVLRTPGATPPSEVPVDGVAYADGGPIGVGATKTYNIAAVDIPLLQTGLAAGSPYSYAVFAYNGSGALTNYLTSSPLTGPVTTTATTPTQQPTVLAYSNITATSMDVSFTPPGIVPDGYLVVRKAVSASTDVPVNRTAYTVGNNLTNDKIVHIGATPNFTDTGLTAGTTYFYVVFSLNGSGVSTAYNTTAPLIGSHATLAVEPAAQPTSLAFTSITSSSLSLGFTPSSATDYLVLRIPGATPPSEVPVDGVAYADGGPLGVGATKTYNIAAANIPLLQTGLAAGSPYSYAVFAYNGNGALTNYLTSLPLTGTVTTTATTPTQQPTSLSYSNITATSMDVSFTPPGSVPDGYLVLRKAVSASTDVPLNRTAYTVGNNLTNDKIVHIGATPNFTDTGLTAGTTYFYVVFSLNGSGVSTAYNTTAPLTGSHATLAAEPAAQPTSLAFTSITSSSLSLGFTPSSATDYLVLRTTGSTPPSEVPLDGVAYADGGPIGVGATKTYNIAAANIPLLQTGLAAGSPYSYAVFAYNGSGALTNYLTSLPLTGTVTTTATTPTQQPTSLAYSNITATSMDVSFTPPGSVPDGYLVLRKAVSASTDVPLNRTAYTVGNNLTNDKIVHIGATPNFTDTGLTAGTTYFYVVFSLSGSGVSTAYNTTAPLIGSHATLAVEPAAQPTVISFSNLTSTSLTLSFTASGAASYLILRKAGTVPSEVPVDGTSYPDGFTLVSSKAFTITAAEIPFNDTGLTPGTQYSYAVFAFNGSGGLENYLTSSPLTGSATTTAAAPANQPTLLEFSNITISSIDVSFLAAASNPDGYLVVRREAATPTGVPVNRNTYTVGQSLGTGNVIVHVGAATDFVDTGLLAEKVYFYKVFAFNGSGVSTAYLTTSPLAGSQSTADAEPNSQPTNITFTNKTSTSVSVGFTPSTATGFLVLRKPGATPPSETPVDGANYTNGGTLFTSKTFITATAPFNDTGLTPETQYSYAIFAYNGNLGANNYLTAGPLTGTVLTPAVPPAAQPTAVTFTSVETENVTVSFTPPVPAPDGYLVVRREGSAPNGGPVNGIAYAEDDPVGDGVAAYVGTGTNFIDTELLGETRYYYEVYAFNGTGTTTSYSAAAPASGNQLLFAWEPIRQPTLLTISNLTTTGWTVGFTPDPDEFADGHIVIRKLGSAPTGVPVDGTSYVVGEVRGDGIVAYVGDAASFNETLALGQYHYKVYAFNGANPGALNYNPNLPLTGEVPLDNTGPTFTNNGTPSTIGSGLQLTISYTVADTDTDPVTGLSLSGPVTLEFKALTAQGSAYTPVEMTKGTDVTGGAIYSHNLTATEVGDLGVIYRIKATNAHGTQATSAIFKALVSLSDLTLPTVSAGSTVEDYRIIAVPLALSNGDGDVVFADLGDSEGGKRWRMFQYASGSTTEITSLSSLNVAPGKGYWLISRDAVTLHTGGGVTVDVTDTQPFTIPLTSGWNQIGNPYMFNLWWADINTTNGTELGLVTYNGGFTADNKLNKFEGGFIQTDAGIGLNIPTAKNPSAGRETTIEPKTNPLDSDDWEVILNLRNGNFNNPFGGVGMSRDAKPGYDHFDNFTLPRFFNYVELNHYKTAYGMTYTKDILPLTENQTWEFAIDANLRGTTEVTWDNSYFGTSDRQIVLWDEEGQQSFDMRVHSAFYFEQGGRRKFKIFFGDQEYVEEKIELLNGLRIHSISPNPSSNDVRVAFTLPGSQSSQVQVRVMNGMGQQIVNVFEGELDAGYHEVTWSGREVNGERPAQGVYLVEVINGERRISKRLVIKR